MSAERWSAALRRASDEDYERRFWALASERPEMFRDLIAKFLVALADEMGEPPIGPDFVQGKPSKETAS